MADGDDATRQAFDRLALLLEFPVDFPLKVLGRRIDGFEAAIADIVGRHVPDFDPARFESRASTKGTYLSLTAVLTIDSREQLEALHRELSAHPWVRVVL
ncbi:MAG: DUF493 domain-containing protein [Burkholderiaceae bacterium]